MRALDKTKIYDLSELNNEELQQVLDFLRKDDSSWCALSLENFSTGLDTSRLIYTIYRWGWVCQKPTTNAKELFYTLDNVQVNCRNLTREHIKEMAKISGYKKGNLECYHHYNYFRIAYNTCNVGVYEESKTTITYEKFMELFGYKEKSEEFKNLVEVLNEELTEEAYKETEYEVKYIAEKPKQYQAHYNNENGSLYKIATDLGLNHWEFDIFKRLVRCRKKNQFKEDLQKIKDTIDIYLNEYSE